ncbi:MAG: lysylphosphatidylglycerol synthase domain-containing protein [Verrucomicrobiota bacterium]
MKKWSPFIHVALGILVVFFIAQAFQQNGNSLVEYIPLIKTGPLCIAIVLLVLYRVWNAYGWGLCLKSLHIHLSFWESVRIWWLSEALRWLPGSIWGYFSRAAQAKQRGIPTMTASLSLTIELGLTIAAWTTTASIGLLVGALDFGLEVYTVIQWSITFFFIGLAAFAFAACLLAKFPGSLIAKKVLRLIASFRSVIRKQPDYKMMAFTYVYYIAMCSLNGLAFYFILLSVSDTPISLATAIGVNSAGWLAGFLAIGAPAGIGIREAGITGLLAPIMPVQLALIASLLWRFTQICVELLCLSLCWSISLKQYVVKAPKSTENLAS